jgi:hypothetical protein
VGLFFWDYKTLWRLIQIMLSVFVFSTSQDENAYKFFRCSFYDLLFFFWFFSLLFSWAFFFIFDYLSSIFFFFVLFVLFLFFSLVFFFLFFGYDVFGFFGSFFSWVTDIQYDQEIFDREEIFLFVVLRYFFLHFLNLFQVFFDFFSNLVVEEDYFLAFFYDPSYFNSLNENAAMVDFFFMEIHALFYYFIYIYYFFVTWRLKEEDSSDLFVFLSYVFGFLLCGNFETEVDLFDEYMYIRTKSINSVRLRTNFPSLLRVNNRDFNLLRFFFSFIRNTRDLAVSPFVFSSLFEFNKQLALQSSLFISPVEQELDEKTLLDFYFFGFFSFFVFFKFNAMPKPHVYFFDDLLKSRFLGVDNTSGFVNFQFSNFMLFLDRDSWLAFSSVDRAFFLGRSCDYVALKFLVTDEARYSYIMFIVRSMLFFESGSFKIMRKFFCSIVDFFGSYKEKMRMLPFERFFFDVFIDFYFFFFRFFIDFIDYICLYYLFYEFEGFRIFMYLIERNFLSDEDFCFIFLLFVVNKLGFSKYFKDFDLASFLLNFSKLVCAFPLYYEITLPITGDSREFFYLSYQTTEKCSDFSEVLKKNMVVLVENPELFSTLSALIFQAKVDLFIGSDFFVYYFVFIGNSRYCLIYVNNRVFLFPVCVRDVAFFVKFDFFFSFFKSI